LNEIDTTTASPDATPAGGDSSKPASPVTVGGMTLKKRAPRPAGAAPSSAPAPTLVKRPGGAPRPAGPAGAAGGPPKGVSKRMERFSRVMPSRDPGVRMNENIRVAEIRVIDAEGQMIGVMSPREAIDLAREKEMDLIEIVPNAKPPVCKIVEFGKWKYEQQKKEKQAKKSSHQQLLKEVRFHPRTDTHDFEFKVRHARTFIEEGNKVKAYVQFKGREVSYKQFGEVLLNDFKKRMEDIAKVDQDISMMGRMMSMVLSPSGKKKAEPKEGKEPKEPREPKEAKEAKKPSTDGVAADAPAPAEPEE
jgi:translation initiation factor IF-3